MEWWRAFCAFHQAVAVQCCGKVSAIVEDCIKVRRRKRKKAFWVKSLRACVLVETFLLLFLLF